MTVKKNRHNKSKNRSRKKTDGSGIDVTLQNQQASIDEIIYNIQKNNIKPPFYIDIEKTFQEGDEVSYTDDMGVIHSKATITSVNSGPTYDIKYGSVTVTGVDPSKIKSYKPKNFKATDISELEKVLKNNKIRTLSAIEKKQFDLINKVEKEKPIYKFNKNLKDRDKLTDEEIKANAKNVFETLNKNKQNFQIIIEDK